MSPINPRCAKPVPDPRSTPGDHPAQGAPGRRGVIQRWGALNQQGDTESEGPACSRHRFGVVASREGGLRLSPRDIPAMRGIDGGAEGSALRLNEARPPHYPGHWSEKRDDTSVRHNASSGSRGRARSGSRYQARPVDFSPCRRLPTDNLPGRA